MGFPTDMYPVLFVLPLMAGWLAHWVEGLSDGTTTAPKQSYRGRGTRQFVEMS
jgi:citrate synthase